MLGKRIRPLILRLNKRARRSERQPDAATADAADEQSTVRPSRCLGRLQPDEVDQYRSLPSTAVPTSDGSESVASTRHEHLALLDISGLPKRGTHLRVVDADSTFTIPLFRIAEMLPKHLHADARSLIGDILTLYRTDRFKDSVIRRTSVPVLPDAPAAEEPPDLPGRTNVLGLYTRSTPDMPKTMALGLALYRLRLWRGEGWAAR